MKRLLVAIALAATCQSGCYLKQYPVTPQVAEASTYEVFVRDVQGTAWVVDPHHLVTAGHMCEGFANSPYTLVSSSGRRTTARAVAWEMKTGLAGWADLCLLATDGPLAPPLVISDSMPKAGDKVSFVGYPNDELSRSDGVYIGDYRDGTGDNTAPCDHGASGAAMYTATGVWGVLVHVKFDLVDDQVVAHPGSEGCTAIKLDALRSFLKWAGVDYTHQPEMPELPEDHIGLG